MLWLASPAGFLCGLQRTTLRFCFRTLGTARRTGAVLNERLSLELSGYAADRHAVGKVEIWDDLTDADTHNSNSNTQNRKSNLPCRVPYQRSTGEAEHRCGHHLRVHFSLLRKVQVDGDTHDGKQVQNAGGVPPLSFVNEL